jgi:hypothetical protein
MSYLEAYLIDYMLHLCCKYNHKNIKGWHLASKDFVSSFFKNGAQQWSTVHPEMT